MPAATCTDVVGAYLAMSRKLDGIYELRSPSLPGDVPRTSVQFYYNRVATDALSSLIGAADKLAPGLAGSAPATWARDRAKYFEELKRTFGPMGFKAGETWDPQDAELPRDVSERLWIATLRLAIAMDSMRVVPSDASLVLEALKESLPDLPSLPELGRTLKLALAVLGLGLAAYLASKA